MRSFFFMRASVPSVSAEPTSNENRMARGAVALSAGTACNLSVLLAESKTPCVPGRTVGCVDERTMWVRQCRGRFRCNGNNVSCGYARHHQFLMLRQGAGGPPIACSCDARCVEAAHTAPPPVQLPVARRKEEPRLRSAGGRADARGRQGASVAVVMYETRPLGPGTYWSLAAAHNERFAHAHGLAFRLFVPPDVPPPAPPLVPPPHARRNLTRHAKRPPSGRRAAGRRLSSRRARMEAKSAAVPGWTVGCYLNGSVARATTWCKLLVVAQAVRRYTPWPARPHPGPAEAPCPAAPCPCLPGPAPR